MLAVTQHGHVVTDLKDFVQSVRNVNHGDILLAQFLDDAEQPLNFAFGNRRRRFVHNNDVRLAGSCFGNLHDLLLGNT